jgi:hypothetical protein
MRISFIGNCQVRIFAACTQAMLPDAEIFGIPLGDSLEPAERSDIVFLQTVAVPHVHNEFPNSLVRRVPTYSYWGFHPDQIYAFADNNPLLSAMGSYSSAIALYAWMNDLAQSAALTLFCDAVYDHLGYYEYTQWSREYLINQGIQSDLDVSELLDGWNRRGCFGYTITHPKLFVVSSIARAALKQVGVEIAPTYSDDAVYDSLADEERWPVYTEVAERLALPGEYQFKTGHGMLDLEQFVALSFAAYATVPKEKIYAERLREQRALYRDLEKLVPGRRRRTPHPYSLLPDHHFWQRSVTNIDPSELDPIVDPKFQIDRDDKIATAGSCFSQTIAKTLINGGFNFYVSEQPPEELSREAAAAMGYGLFSARFGNVYSTRQLLQLFQRAYSEFIPADVAWLRHDEKFIDPFRPQLEPDGYCSVEDVVTARIEHLGAVRTMFEQANVFIFTMGLTEAWAAKCDGAIFPVAPQVVSENIDSNDYVFCNLTVSQMISDLNEFIQKLRAVNGTVRLLFTVSPVAMIATYEKQHVLVSNTYSKSAIRAAIGEVVRQYDYVDYFPSYEVVTGGHSGWRYLASDLRTITDEGVDRVVQLFSKHYLHLEPQLARVSNGLSGLALRAAETAGVARIICDEELLNSADRAAR